MEYIRWRATTFAVITESTRIQPTVGVDETVDDEEVGGGGPPTR